MPVNDVCQFMHDGVHQPGGIVYGIRNADNIGAWGQRAGMAEA